MKTVTMKIFRNLLIIVLVVVAGRAFNADAQIVTILHSFVGSPTDGYQPYAGLVQDSDSNFFGTTVGGGQGLGTVFRISPSGTCTTLYSFIGSPTDGDQPYAGLVQGRDGNFYGTTYYGGTNDNGTVFRISPSGNYTSLYSFVGFPTDGQSPAAGLVEGSDSNFYGTTYYGGLSTNCVNGCGTVFQISPSGTYTSLYSFVGPPTDGDYPYTVLVQGSDGSFYGTTSHGGTSTNCYLGCGTVFRISPSGSYTNLYSFGGYPNDGSAPLAGLVEGSDGNFYGTAREGGQNNVGTVFRISPSGSYTNLYSFATILNDGDYPDGGLVQGSDGSFYGTTFGGGTSTNCGYSGCGTVFRISPSGNYTSLYSFVGFPNDGQSPAAGLVEGSDGNFYGTTYQGGSSNNGVIFSLTLAGQLTVTKLQAKVNLNPAKSNMNSCSLTAMPALEPSFSVANKAVTVEVGGAQATFTLNAKGRGTSSPNTCRLSYNKKTQLWTLTASLKKGSWATPWAAYGLTNDTTPRGGVTVTLPVTLVIDNGTFAGEKSLLYIATAGKSGTAR